MKTIPRNHARRLRAVRATARYCERYDRDSGGMVPCTVDAAFTALDTHRSARMQEDEPDARWTVHVHSNLWYTLTVQDPKEARERQRCDREEDRAGREAHQRQEAPPDAGAAPGTGDRAARAALIAALPGFDRHTRAASQEITGRHQASGLLARDASSASVPEQSRSRVAATVRELRGKGWPHERIREHFTAVLRQAQSVGDAGRAAAAETFLAVHAGILADLAALAQLPGAPMKGGGPVPVAAAPVGGAQQDEPQEAEAVSGQRPVFRPAAWWEDPDKAVTDALPAPRLMDAGDAGVAVELPPHEAGYEPLPGAKPYPVRAVRAALEAAGIALDGEEFPVLLASRGDDGAHVIVHHSHGRGAKPPRGPARDRWERRRAALLVALVDAGMSGVELSTTGVGVRVPRATGAATVVQLGQRTYGDAFDAEFIEQAVSLPQYPQVTGWVLRRRWGAAYRGPLTPWMHHAGTGEDIGTRAQSVQAAAEALAVHYGLMFPVRVWGS